MKKLLKIKMYNDTYFDKPPLSQSASKDIVICQLDELALKPHVTPNIPTVIDIFKEFETEMTNIFPIEVIPHESNGCKHVDILASQSKLFFIKYTPEHTLRQRLYLLQVDLAAALEENKDVPARDSYRCVYLAKHPNDANRSDEFSRF